VSTEKAQLNLWEELAPIQKRVWGRVSKEARQKRLIVCRTCARRCAGHGINLCLRRNNRCTWEGGRPATPCESARVVAVQVARHHVAQAIWIRT
jgi:hypothetical protein